MMTENDMSLVREFVTRQSETAFAALVERYIGLVHSAAMRQAGDPDLAQEITQAVFILLARKAATLGPKTILPAWLYRSTRYAVADALKARRRRRAREQEAFMQSTLNVNESNNDTWRRLAPLLDDALAELGETDRAALVLRYFENKSAREIAASLRLEEATAQKRVARALEKLRAYFGRHGVTLTTTAIAAAVAANAVQAAPAGMVVAVKAASLAAAGTGTFSLLQFMSLMKIKLTLGTLVVAGTTSAFVIQHQAQLKLRANNDSLRQQMDQLQSDNQSLSSRLAAATPDTALPDAQMQELLKLRGEIGVLRRQLAGQGKLQAENERLQAQVAAAKDHPVQADPALLFAGHGAQMVNAVKLAGVAMYMYSAGHQGLFPTNFAQMTEELEGKTNIAGISLDAMEFVNAGQASRQYPQMIMLRERLPRQNPDGGWEREYCLADGSVQTETSPNGNFDAYEQQQAQYGPPPGQ
jgi:RNA polymerase sigma factor (sigma-70 family)